MGSYFLRYNFLNGLDGNRSGRACALIAYSPASVATSNDTNRTSVQKHSSWLQLVMGKMFETRFEGSVWHSAPVRPQGPDVVLVGWHVFELQLPGRAERTRHFAGTKAEDGHGKASTAIVAFDHAARRGVTESGRVYVLESSPGLEMNAACAWDAFVRVNRAVDIVDVSAEINALSGG